MTAVHFDALEYHADARFERHAFGYEGDPAAGWRVTRDGEERLVLGPGYRLLRTLSCGVCSTDLARHHLPFPLPQVTGHELVACDEDGRELVVEINASHRARGLAHAETCPFCAAGLATHCPERLVLGIHDLPGGFGPWVLAPIEAALPLPAGLPRSTAVLVEPFAAALHAVTTLFPEDGRDVERVAVLGPRRLGLLVVAALDAWRRRRDLRFEIVALSRHAPLLELAHALGADRGEQVLGDGANLARPLADVVVDTTGAPQGLELALELAREEVHLKSTHGRPAAGLAHLTELVVDELRIEPFEGADGGDARPVAWLARAPVGAAPGVASGANVVERGASLDTRAAAADLLERIEHDTAPGHLPRAARAVVDDAEQVDAAIRPRVGDQPSLVAPRGAIQVVPGARTAGSPLLATVVERGLRLSSSRCGDFRAALALLSEEPSLADLGERFVTHRFASDELERAFATARTPACIKAVVEFGGPRA